MLKHDHVSARVPREMTRLPRAGNPEGVKALEAAAVMLVCAAVAVVLLFAIDVLWGLS